MPEKIKKETLRYGEFAHNLFIAWKPEYNLGISIIDEQHHGIVTTINSLFFAIQNNHGEKILHPIIDMVHDYTRIHFDVEEDFLKKYGYPNLKQHHKLHNDLIHKLNVVGKKSLMSNNPLEFMEFLKNWWIDHICEKDKEFLDYLIATLR